MTTKTASLVTAILAVLFATGSGALALLHPVWPAVQVACCGVCFVVGLSRPLWFFAMFPAALVMADGYPWTGQLVLREYDSLLLACLAGVMVASFRARRCQIGLPSFAGNRLALLGWVLWMVSVLISGMIGWRSLPTAPWADQLSVYFTQWNAVRVTKGFVWGFVYMTLLRSLREGSLDSHDRENDAVEADASSLRILNDHAMRMFALGVTIALVYVGGFVVFERWLYVSLWDFSDIYRASGPIWTMHIGGQHIDALLVMAFPLMWLTFLGKRPRQRLRICLLVFCVMLVWYASIATMSRATIAIILLQTVALVWLACGPARLSGQINRRRVAGPFVIVSIAVALAGVTIVASPGVRARFANSKDDFGIRLRHWSKILDGGIESPLQWAFGNGIGTFPTFMANESGRAVPPIKLDIVGDKTEITVQGNWPLYLETIVPPAEDVFLGGSARCDLAVDDLPESSNDNQGSLVLIRSVKSVFQSYESVSSTVLVEVKEIEFAFGFPDPTESEHEADTESARAMPSTQGPDGLLHPSGNAKEDVLVKQGQFSSEVNHPISRMARFRQRNRLQTLAVYCSGDPIRIDNMILSDGRGNFIEPRWIFTCDDHLVWRTKNVLVQLLFEHGLMGVLGFLLLAISLAVRVVDRRTPKKNAFICRLNPFQAISLLGIMGVAFFGTLMDTAWISAFTLAAMTHFQSDEG